MLETLELVFGAVATKDIVPVMTHVCIHPGRMQGGDGVITIDAPFVCDLPPCAVPGQKFLNAVRACKGTPNLAMTDGGRLSVKKGSFKAFLSVLPEGQFPVDTVRGESVPVPSTLLKALKTIRPFVSKDASRPWSMGVYLSENYAYATNNVILVRVPVDWNSGTDMGLSAMVLPTNAIDALLDLQELPSELHVDSTSATFTYNDGSWLKTRLTSAPWPNVAAMLDAAQLPTAIVQPELLEAVQKVKKFCTNVKFPTIQLSEEGVASDDGGGDIASVEGLQLPKSSYNGDMLELVLTHATYIDFTAYPKPCTFQGAGDLEGLFVGLLSA